MLKKTITYKNFNGEIVTEDFYFHITKAQLMELELRHMGMLAYMRRIIAAEDGQALYDVFSDLVLRAYGKRSDDGSRFIKNQEISDEFASTQAFSDLIVNLMTDTDFAIEFFNSVIPEDMREEMAKAMENLEKEEAEEDKEEVQEVKVMTKSELYKLPSEEFTKFTSEIAEGRLRIVDDTTNETTN